MEKLKLLGFICNFFIFGNLIAQTTGDYRTAASSVTWATASNWQTWNGSQWITASSAPGSSNDVYIQAGHTATLSGNESCKSLFISTGTTNATTGGDGKVALISYTLNVNGKLSCYYGNVDITNGSGSALSLTFSTSGPSAPITKTSGGILKIVGDTRNITVAGEWDGGASGATTLFDIEIAMNSGQTATLNTILKAANWIISSGTLETSLRISADNNTAGQGDITIGEGAIFSSSESGSSTPVISRTTTSGTGTIGTITINGKLILKGSSPYIQCSGFIFGTNGEVEYARSNSTGNQDFVDASYTGAVKLLSYQNIILSGIGTKTTLPSETTEILANGSLTMKGGAIAVGSSASFNISTTNTTLIYSGSSSQTATNAEWNSNFQNLTIDNSSGVSLGSLTRTINGTLTLTKGNVTGISNLTLANGATIVKTGGSFSSTPNFGTTVNVSYNQHTSPISTGNELPASSTVLNNLTINTSNGVTLTAACNLNGTLTFNKGILTTTASNLLTIETTGTVSGQSDSGFINGPVAKKTNSTSQFTFPTGKGNVLRTISVTPVSTSATTFNAEYFNTFYSDTSTFTSPILRVSKMDYFILNRTSGSTNAVMKFDWGSNSGVNTSYISELTIARFASGSWVNEAGTGSGNSSGGTITSNSAVAAFGIFALANIANNHNLLPVKFLYFKIKDNELEWATASEINCKGFEIEESTNGSDFYSIGFINSKSKNGFSNQNLYYTYPNEIIKNETLYYRLKQIDNNGGYQYSSIIKKSGLYEPGFTIKDNTLQIFDLETTNNTLEIIDLYGRVLHQGHFQNNYFFDINNLHPGFYYLTLNTSSPIKFFKP